MTPISTWAASDLGAIGHANPDGSGVEPSVIAGLDGPLGVAADGGHVYWTEYVDPVATIGRAGVDGTGVDRGFILAEWIAVQLAVDDRHIYWSYEGDQRIGPSQPGWQRCDAGVHRRPARRRG